MYKKPSTFSQVSFHFSNKLFKAGKKAPLQTPTGKALMGFISLTSDVIESEIQTLANANQQHILLPVYPAAADPEEAAELEDGEELNSVETGQRMSAIIRKMVK